MAAGGNITLRLLLTAVVWTLLPAALGQQQRFRVRPSNVSVVEGDSQTLLCEVNHQAGDVQWARHGFALGYERSLPGFPRYQLVGDPVSGVNNLEITNVTLEDDGWFQCQVSPSGGQEAIRTAAFVTVLLKPVSVVVTSSAREPRPGVFEVREGSDLSLQCDVTEAKPAATVQWQRNGANIYPEGEVAFSEPDEPQRNDTTSTITLQPTHVDDGARYSCLAQHPAVRPAEQARFNTTVVLSVLYRPGSPEITGYEEDEIVRMGEKKTLVCVSRAGNPLAELVWFKNDEPITYQYRTIRNRAVSEYTFKADATDLNALYRCEASSIVHPQPMVALLRMNVQFGPESVEVTGTDEAKRGDTIEMSCVTSSSNPAANITWLLNGHTAANTSQEITSHAEGGWVTASNMSATIPADMREDMVVSCYALNPALGLTEVGTHKVTVQYPPKPPRILGYLTGTHLKSGQRVSLSCVAQGGNPAASLTWYKGDQSRDSETDVEDGVARSVLAFTVDYRDNEKVFKCSSTNPALDEPHTVNVTLLVYYPPSRLSLKVKPKRLKAGVRAVLMCDSKPSNPAADLTWWRDSEMVTQGVSNVTSKPSGNHGGFTSRIRLRKRLKWTDDQAVYTCRSTVSVLAGNMHDAITLSVTFAPVFADKSASEDIVVGESRLLNYTARASPDNITYSWYRGDAPLPSDAARVVGLGPLLNVTDVAKVDSGSYRLEATNAEGTSKFRVNINVQYQPEIASISREVLVVTGTNAVLECVADANPTTDDMITWSRDEYNFDTNKTKTFYSNGTSFLTVYGAAKADIGLFLCQVDNGLGQVNATAGLLVEHEPVIDTSPQYLKAAAEKGDTGHVTCRARGAPNVTFEWSKRGAVIDDTTDADKYQLVYTREDLLTWQSVLKVLNVVTADYGVYVCVARNELNFERRELVLGGTTSPDPPVAVHASNVTSDSVRISWTPGFDGGLIQRYRIRYTATVGPERFSYEDVQPENATEFTVALPHPNTEYSFSVMAYNDLGHSAYTKDVVKVTTIDRPDVRLIPEEDGTRQMLSQVAIVIVTVAGAILLIINIVLISCYVRRRQQRLKAESSVASWRSDTLQMYGSESPVSLSTGAGGSLQSLDSPDDSQENSSGQDYDWYPGGLRRRGAAGYSGRPGSPTSTYRYQLGQPPVPETYLRPVPTPDLVPGVSGYRHQSDDPWGADGMGRGRPFVSPPASVRSDVNFEQRGQLF